MRTMKSDKNDIQKNAGTADERVVYAEEIDVPNGWHRLNDALKNPTFKRERLSVIMRAAQILFGLLAVLLSTSYDLPFSTDFSVQAGNVTIINAGIIQSMFRFPAYIYLTTVALITLLGAIIFVFLMLLDLSLVGGSSEHEALRFAIDNNVPFIALCFDFIFLILSLTSACAVLGLTTVLGENFVFSDSESSPVKIMELAKVFHFKHSAAAFMLAQSICITATLIFGWQHVEERKRQMTQLNIPPQATQQYLDRIFHFWNIISSGVGKRSYEKAVISPLFVNRCFQVLASMAGFICCHVLSSGDKHRKAFHRVLPFEIMTWVSLAVLIVSIIIASVSAVDILLSGGKVEMEGEGKKRNIEKEKQVNVYRGLFQSSGSRITEYFVYGRMVYDSIFSLFTFSVFAAAAGVTTAQLNCRTSESWCTLSVVSVFFMFALSISFMMSLFTGSYVEFRDLRLRIIGAL